MYVFIRIHFVESNNTQTESPDTLKWGIIFKNLVFGESSKAFSIIHSNIEKPSLQADGLGREWEVLWGEINAHIRLRLPDRAPAQHLLGCVWAKLWEGLECKALTTHYTADKAICEESFLKATATFLLYDCWHGRFVFLLNIVKLLVRGLTYAWSNYMKHTAFAANVCLV